MSLAPTSAPTPGGALPSTSNGCGCGASSLTPAERGARLLSLDNAVRTGQVTTAEAAERRAALLAR